MGREPSRDETTTEPVASFGLSARNISDGFATSARPDSFISEISGTLLLTLLFSYSYILGGLHSG
jgi:hypothetical protein